MKASTAMILSLLAAVFGYFLSILLHSFEVMTSLTVIVMGGCIIYSIQQKPSQTP